MGKIRCAIAGVGNCSSALVQGVQYYRNDGELTGLINEKIGDHSVSDVEFAAAFDIDQRKVGRDLSEAIFSEPNKFPRIAGPSNLGVEVMMGEALDGVESNAEGLIKLASGPSSKVSEVLKDQDVDVLVNLVSGSAIEASKFYAEAALEAECSFLNATPAPVASNETLSKRFQEAGLPLAGDDLLDQVGATVVHIGLLEFLHDRGVRIDESYQLDVGGGAESANTLWKTRGLKREIKTRTQKSTVKGKVTINKKSKIVNSKIIGPSIIGSDCSIENSFIGPYTSIGNKTKIINSFIENCIILDNSSIQGVKGLKESLIGKNTKITQNIIDKCLKLHVGDYSEVEI